MYILCLVIPTKVKISSLQSTFQVKFNDEKLSKLVLPSNLTKVMLRTEKQPILT